MKYWRAFVAGFSESVTPRRVLVSFTVGAALGVGVWAADVWWWT